MKYLDKTFSVAAPDTDTYRDNWERTFGKREPVLCRKCGYYLTNEVVCTKCGTLPEHSGHPDTCRVCQP